MLAGCSAPYEVPTDHLGRPLERIQPKVTTIDAGNLDAEEAGSSYVVRRGDTLFSIAWRFEQDPDLLKRRNQLRSDLIQPGQSLKLKGDIPPEPEPEVQPAPKRLTPPVIKAEPEPGSDTEAEAEGKHRNRLSSNRRSQRLKQHQSRS
jgi:lipoprotein NlpD